MRGLIVFGLMLSLSVAAANADESASLPRSTPEAQGIASADILAFIEAANAEIDTMNSFMLVRHGHVVAEGWWAPYEAESRHVLYSLTKSFTATAVGMAVADGLLSLDDRVLGFFPDLAPEEPSDNLRAMRVHDLIRMGTGHETEPPAPGPEVPWAQAFLAHPVPHRPGTHFLYNTPASHMLSVIVQKVTGMTVEDYLRPRLFAPLGIEDPLWQRDAEGVSIGGYGLNVRTEDIAKFGQLYLQKGLWAGRQLLPAGWVEAATSRQIANGSDPASDWHQGYGYQFWRSRHNAYRGDGAFGQYALVLPDQDVVIAITSGVRNMQAVLDLVFAKLLPAMRAAELPYNPADHRALVARLAKLQVRPAQGTGNWPDAPAPAGRAFAFDDNALGIEAVTFQFDDAGMSMKIRSTTGNHVIRAGRGSWQTGRSSFAFGLDQNFGLPPQQAIAASGAWADDQTLKVKLCRYETPFYASLSFRFDGDNLRLAVEQNVAFRATEPVVLTGRAGQGG